MKAPAFRKLNRIHNAKYQIRVPDTFYDRDPKTLNLTLREQKR